MRRAAIKGRDRIGKERGSILILAMIALPILVTMLAIVIDMGRISVAHARLEVAADRAAYAGSASLAYSLNEIAKKNWEMHKAWRDLAADFSSDTQKDEEMKRRRIAVYESARNGLSADIGTIQDAMAGRAGAISQSAFHANSPAAAAAVKAPGLIGLSDSENENQKGETHFGHVTGTIFTDPNSVETGSYSNTKYLTKPVAPNAFIEVDACQSIRPMLLGRFYKSVNIGARSGAQAFGGSIEEFAKKETGSFGDAEGIIDASGSDALYRAALVPTRAFNSTADCAWWQP